MSSQAPPRPNGEESNPDGDQAGYRKNNYNNNSNRPRQTYASSGPRPSMPPRQMSSVPQQSQQTWQPQAQQQTQQVAYMYSNYQYAAPPQNQNGQFYQAYGYPAQPYAVYQTPNGQAYAYGYYPGGQGSVVYQQQPAMMYQMPMGQPQVAAPPMTQSRPPAAPIPPTSPAPAAPPVAPVTPAPPQPANEEPVHVTATNEPAVENAQAPSTTPAAPTSTSTPVAPTPAKKKPTIKYADGSVVDVEELKKKPVPPKEPETAKAPEPETSVPSIPSMPVSLPKVETPVVNSFPVDIARPAVSDKVVEEKPSVESTPVKEPPAVSEDESKVAVLATPEQSSQRRLVPQGKKNLSTPGSKTIRKYTKQEIMNLKPTNLPKLDLFNNIVVQKLEGPMSKGSAGNAPNWSNKDKNAKAPASNNNDWKHEPAPSPSKKSKGPAAPPKQEITDPMKLIELYITDILNKIAPEKFEVLSNQLLGADLKDSTMLDKLVQLIFEKAVKEPHFAEMYARLCTFLKDEGGKKWVFFKVVKNLEDNTFFWIKDFSFPEMAAGPFFSKSDVFATEDLGQMKAYTGSLDGCEYFLNKQTLMRLIPVKSASGDQWFVTHVSFDEVKTENRGNTVYTTEAEAVKNATSTVSFRGSLAHSCEREFKNSVADENLFDEVDQELKQLVANRANISEEEYLTKEANIGEKRGKLKQRMLGNIRFVGELYKQKLLNTDTMHECIVTLLGHPGNWKTEHDVQDLELLCKLLTTVGSYLESKSIGAKKKPEWEANFLAYFDRLQALTKDKTLEARIRFSIEDVIDLRRNGWKERREKEGPLKISEIHQKAQEEEQMKGQITRQNSTGDARNIGGKGGDIRNSGNVKGGRGDSKGGRGSGGRGSGDGNRGGGKASAAAVPAGPVVENIDLKTLDFSNDAMKRRAKTVLLEYMSGEDIGEVKSTLKEGSNVFIGFLLNDIIDKLLNNSKGGVDRLMAFFDDEELMKSFQTYSGVVEVALEQNDFFKVLVDTTLDFKEAPEKIGQVVRVLIQKHILTLAKVQEITEKLKKYNVELEYNPVEDINSAYDKFLQSTTA